MDHQLVQQIYSANIQPERFEELLASWEEKLIASRRGETGAFEHPDVLVHIRQAVAMFEHFDPEQPAASDAAGSVEGPYPVLICDERGRVVFANAPAKRRYAVEDVGELPFEPATLTAIRRAIAMMAKNIGATPTVISAQKTRSEPPSVVSVHPYSGNVVSGPGFVQITSNDFTWPEGLNRTLEQTFALSNAECGVMQLMAEGASVAQVAELRGSSVSTVRVQVRAIYEKTGVRNQAEMLRLAIGFVNVFNVVKPDGEARPPAVMHPPAVLHPLASERQLLLLGDGRRLGFTDLGAADGAPVVIMHDEYYGDIWSAAAVQRATRLGLRLINPARPYFGQSDGYPEGAKATDQFSRDVRELLEYLGVDRFGVLARRTGFRYAVHLAHEVPERLVGIVALSPSLPALSTDEYRDMTRFARLMSHAVFKNPALVELACQAGIRYYRHMGPRKFAHILNRGSELDLATLDDPEHWRLIREGMQFAVANGYLGYLHDVLHDPAEAWHKTIDCPIPVRCLIGSDDPNDRLRRAGRCIDAGADMSVREVAGAAQLFFHAEFDSILEELRRCWQKSTDQVRNVGRGSHF